MSISNLRIGTRLLIAFLAVVFGVAALTLVTIVLSLSLHPGPLKAPTWRFRLDFQGPIYRTLRCLWW